MKTIVWDFDGVIILSEEIRVKGFEILFKRFPYEDVQKLIQFHTANGGLSRYVKIRYFFEEILKESISNEKLQSLAMDFSEIMRQELTDPGLLNPEWLCLMEEIGNHYNHHVASGSDGNELRYLCSELEIVHYFESIEGSPTPKIKLVEEILARNRYSHQETCLVGDAINDWEAAHQNSIQFYGYRNEILKDKGGYLYQLSELKAHLK
jgi:phosphoglycolate phosphatase-like HAD superfamily hydrolase